MGLSRRCFVSTLSAIALGQMLPGWAVASGAEGAGPILWLVEHKGAKTYIFGFGDAEDRSWFSTNVQAAFKESKEVWFETPQGPISDQDQAEDDRLEQQLGHDDKRSLFDVLGPGIGARTLALMQELGVSRNEVEHLRPWLAYFTINSAFWRHYPAKAEEFADQVLSGMALQEKKIIRSEYAKPQDTTRWFAALSDEAQREHMEDLLDYIDDEKAGRNQQNSAWITGHPDTRFIDRMRQKRPAMYKEFQVDRNQQWAERIAGFDANDSPYLVVIGLNHVLGPDSLLQCLDRIGIPARRV
jgi:uncharacterized protein YbaP (TraB family)